MQAANTGLGKSIQHCPLLFADRMLSIGALVFGVDFGLFSCVDCLI